MKRRRSFIVYAEVDQGWRTSVVKVATGVLYDELNVQVLWRRDIGWTAEQYASIATLYGLVPNVKSIEVLDG